MATTLNSAVAENVGVFGWNYNRANFKFDQGLRWQRYTTGRKMACAQVGLFRQDITDLAGVSMAKLKVYGPIYGIVITVCVTVYVEGRSGLKFPGPPVFISQIYLQCLGIGMCYMALATWLLFHASMRAQIACVQLRTRLIRMPVPTQRQLDGSRKILSTWEEQGLYGMFRVPFAMPPGAESPDISDEEDMSPSKATGYANGGIPGVAAKVKAKVAEKHKSGATSHNARMPGLTAGTPAWYQKELEDRDTLPESSPTGYGMDGEPTPYKHFELLRAAQREWWGCEAYMRVCFLFGMMHLVMAFSYWITLHNIAELGMIWCSNLGAAGLTAGVWIIFRLDVLPEHGGCFPWEIGGPFVTSIALGLMYSHTVTPTMMNIARVVAAIIILMHVFLTFRLYSVASPTFNKAHHQARESGGRLFNQSGSCEAPSWLPAAFQHVMYLVAPPKTAEQLAKERMDRNNDSLGDDALAKVDMTPWYYVRTMTIAVLLGWFVQLGGHATECVMGERMLVSNPGMPPWSRTGQWFGWEHGPISSKHYAHVTPQRGHWAWQKGWGPQGQQELWASDVFGFHPEADAWWAEKEGLAPLVGAAGYGKNTWNEGVIAYGQNEPKWGTSHLETHDFESSGGHRRLSDASLVAPRPVVPLPVRWPAALEPDILACGPDAASGGIAAVTAGGAGAVVPNMGIGEVVAFSLEGLLEHGMASSVTWGPSGFLVVTGTGRVAACPTTSVAGSHACAALEAPPLPGFAMDGSKAPPTAAFHVAATVEGEGGLWAAMAHGSRVALRRALGESAEWQHVASVEVPLDGAEVLSVAATDARLLVTTSDGGAYHWDLRQGVPARDEPTIDVPASGPGRTWQSACLLPNGKIVRLASAWPRAAPELLV
mmetsp:Transcript_38130/g.115261  ORF Transcript_38130/g.115261 Transcript_38130/m.115261 type:complete len:881 (-) Transcript_38130:138-2780(-)